MKILAENSPAKFNYQILDKWEAGLKLTGPEVKAAKGKKINLRGSYVTIDSQYQAWLTNAQISHYPPAWREQQNYHSKRARPLLLKRSEIIKLYAQIKQPSLTLVPLRVYTKGGLVKVEIALAKGKKKFDKRELLKKREIEKQIQRKLRQKF